MSHPQLALAYDNLALSIDFSHQSIHFPPGSASVSFIGTRSRDTRSRLELQALIPKIDEVLDEIENCIDILFPPILNEKPAETTLNETITKSGLGSHAYSIEVSVDPSRLESTDNK